MKCCTGNCNQGRTCPRRAKQSNANLPRFIIMALALLAASLIIIGVYNVR